jgi:hypothetical protein
MTWNQNIPGIPPFIHFLLLLKEKHASKKKLGMNLGLA